MTDERAVTMKTIESIKEAIAPIAEAYGLKRVYLFGSYAKGLPTEPITQSN